jgi:hypothetical protein
MVSLPSVEADDLDGDVLVLLLLAAFVIVVTSFLTTVVLDMGQPEGGEEVASASVDFREDSGAIFVRFVDMERPDTVLDVTVNNVSGDATIATARLTRVGQLHIFGGLAEDRVYEVVVVAEWNDRRTLVTTRTGSV